MLIGDSLAVQRPLSGLSDQECPETGASRGFPDDYLTDQAKTGYDFHFRLLTVCSGVVIIPCKLQIILGSTSALLSGLRGHNP